MEAMHDERRHAQPQHVLEEQQHIAGQGGYAAPGDHPHGGAPQAKLYDNNLLPTDMRDEQQRAQHWAETHGHSHKQVHAQRQHVLEEQQHIAGQGGYAAPGDLPHGGAPQAKLYDNNLLPADMRDEQQRAQHWAETHGRSHKQVHAQPQHVLEEQQHIAGQGGHAAPGDLPHGGAPQAKLYDKSLLAGDPHGAAPLCMDDLVTNSPRRQLERLLAAAPTAGSRPVSARAGSAADRVGVQARAVAHPVPWCTCTARTRR